LTYLATCKKIIYHQFKLRERGYACKDTVFFAGCVLG
jgi:hypothetical protein